MDSFLQVINQKLICLKDNHNEQIEMVVIDNGVPLYDELLCLKCQKSKEVLINNIRIEEALRLVEVKTLELNQQQEQNFIERIKNLKSDTIKLFDGILMTTDLWIAVFNKTGEKYDLKTLLRIQKSLLIMINIQINQEINKKGTMIYTITKCNRYQMS